MTINVNLIRFADALVDTARIMTGMTGVYVRTATQVTKITWKTLKK
jgi:hypothetical protein